MKLYRGIGELLTEVRRDYFHQTQEEMAEQLNVSDRQVRRWERQEKALHNEELVRLARQLRIPMPVLLSLNANAPIWYSYRKNRFSLFSFDQSWYRPMEDPGTDLQDDGTVLQVSTIAHPREIESILLYEATVYPVKDPLKPEIAEQAARVLPDLNLIAKDAWNLHSGHSVVLPMDSANFERLARTTDEEGSISKRMLVDDPRESKQVLYYFSFWGSFSLVAQHLLRRVASFFRERGEAYLRNDIPVVAFTHTCEAENLLKQLGFDRRFELPGDQLAYGTELVPALYQGSCRLLANQSSAIGRGGVES